MLLVNDYCLKVKFAEIIELKTVNSVPLALDFMLISTCAFHLECLNGNKGFPSNHGIAATTYQLNKVSQQL